MLPTADTYADLIARFRWDVPARFNIAVAACDRWADGRGRLALVDVGADGPAREVSFDRLRDLSNRLANALTGLGAARGDRVAILLGQGLACGVAHLAAYKAGMIALPLFTLFGEEALEYRLADSGARVLITDTANAAKIEPIRDRLPDLEHVILADGAASHALSLAELLDRASDAFTPVDTAADDPALIIYTSGTTGQPKGALHAHRVLLGHLPGVELPHHFFPQAGDRFWTPADWAWIGGLLDVLLPGWCHGVPVVAHRMAKFDADRAMALMRDHAVRNVFLPPTALKLMRRDGVAPWHGLRTLGSGGETLGAELLDWGRETFGLTVNEFYGQTECNLIVGNDAELMGSVPGAMGRAVPGHRVAVIDGEGRAVPPGTVGQIAVARPDPVMFLGYWNKPEATAAKFVGDWLVTGDTGTLDADGWFRFVGRDDDVITSAGYRIGPGEIEDCLMRHPAVALAAAVGVPDPVRTQIVKAVIVLNAGHAPSDALKAEIQDFVKTRLAAHEYPRLVDFADTLPMTATGKIRRRDLR
ncbi:MAG: AMP-binding protein [Alphaproteobacteria bacterium]|jgi:acetyl-CoA synthetase|nr:AMP-binding protein [Alphaproteobacteria bacterium]